MLHHTLLIASANARLRTFLGDQLDADGHSVQLADSASTTLATLAAQAIDIALLAELDEPATTPGLLRAIRAGRHQRVHRAQPIITLGAGDELSALRAYEAGSDHHLPRDAGYVVVRAVIDTVLRRTLSQTTSRHVHVGNLHIDTAARSADVDGTPVQLSRTEFDLLVKLASDPTRVFTKAELRRAIGREQVLDRTIDTHVCRLRTRLAQHGPRLIWSRWGTGYALVDAISHQTQERSLDDLAA